MTVDDSLPLYRKRRRLISMDPMEVEAAQAKYAAIKEKLGREIRVFDTTALSASPSDSPNNVDENDDFYEFTAEDYYRILATKKEDKYLKTRKIREGEEAARRSRITKTIIRVRFPDNHSLEATFQSSETIQSLFDFLSSVIAFPELPFYVYTCPPKKLIKDKSQDFYSAGFIPGAIVYFAYDVPKGSLDDSCSVNPTSPFLQEEILSLKGLQHAVDQGSKPEPSESVSDSDAVVPAAPAAQQPKPSEKKIVKPKWLKM